MKNFFTSLPVELEEAAFIDGAGPLRIFFTIILPHSKAVLATISLWLAVASWNNFMMLLIYLNERELFTLPLYVRQVIDGQILATHTGEGAQTAVQSVTGATIIIAVISIIYVYPFLQKYFVKGVMIGTKNTLFEDIFGAFCFQPTFWMETEDELRMGSTLPATKEALAVLQKWYAEGLIDPDVFTNDKSLQDQKLANSKGGVYEGTGFLPDSTQPENAALLNVTPTAKLAGIPAIKGPNGDSGRQ